MHEKSVFLLFKLLVNDVVWGPLVFQRDGFAGIVLNISFSRCDGRRGTFSFYRKIYKSCGTSLMYRLAPILISGQFDKYFTFMLLALHDGTTAQL